MNDETRNQIGLQWYKIISPMLMETGRNRNEYFRQLAEKEHVFAGDRPKKVAVSTMKLWLKANPKNGFDGLLPKRRADGGRPHRLGEKEMAAIAGKFWAYPHWSVQKLYEELQNHNQLGKKPICCNPLLRIIRQENLLPAEGRSDARKRFEMSAVNEMWTRDFMHGPAVEVGYCKSVKSILCAIIDDHSRVIMSGAFRTKETVSTLTVMLKEAFETHGLPKRLYVDNGAAFSSALRFLRNCLIWRARAVAYRCVIRSHMTHHREEKSSDFSKRSATVSRAIRERR